MGVGGFCDECASLGSTLALIVIGVCVATSVISYLIYSTVHRWATKGEKRLISEIAK